MIKNYTKHDKIQIVADIVLSNNMLDNIISETKKYYKNNKPEIYANYPLLFQDECLNAYFSEISQDYYKQKAAQIRKDASYVFSEKDIKNEYEKYVFMSICERINEDVSLYSRKNRKFNKFHFIFCTDPANTTKEIEKIAQYIFEHFEFYKTDIENVVDDIIENIPFSAEKDIALTYVFNSVAEVIQEKDDNMSDFDAINNNLYDKIVSKIAFYKA